MSRARTVRQIEVTRAIRGALAAGLAPGSFRVECEGGIVRLLPIADALADSAAEDMERRMKEAFGV